jgi:hypothetical protein
MWLASRGLVTPAIWVLQEIVFCEFPYCLEWNLLFENFPLICKLLSYLEQARQESFVRNYTTLPLVTVFITRQLTLTINTTIYYVLGEDNTATCKHKT